MPKTHKSDEGDEFFPPPPPAPVEADEDPEAPRFWREWEHALRPPAEELGSELPIRIQLCKSANQSIWLLSSIVFSTGILIHLGGFSRPDAYLKGGTNLDRLGIAFGDGSTATSRDTPDMDRPPNPPALARMGSRSSAGPFSRTDETYWVFGLPTEGKLWLHYGWAGDGSRRHIVELDSEPIRELAG